MPPLVSSFALSSGSSSILSTPLASISEWYKTLTDSKAKSIRALQIRKDITGAVPHRFIVLQMCDGRVHRLDRRPDRGPEGGTGVVGLLANRAVTSQDSYVLDISLEEEERTSQCEIELLLNGRADLSTVISACHAISTDDSAGKYTFLRHNCFFFSWTILMVVSRHCLPYEVPPHNSIMNRFQSELNELASFIVGEAIPLFINMIIDIMTIFREKPETGTSLRQGMSVVERAAWALPIGVLRPLWRRLLTVRILHFGLRDQLAKMIKAKIIEQLGPVYEAAVSTHMTHDMLNNHLWIEETKDTVKEGLKTEMMKVLWVSILEVISIGLGSIEPEQLAEQLTDPRLKFSLLGRNVAQFYAVWNAMLHGGLQAAKGAGQDLGGLSHGAAFDLAWIAARDGALRAAQTVVQNTSAALNKPKRDEMWASVWAIWDDCWDDAHKVVRPRTIQVVERIVEAILATGVKSVIQDIKEYKANTIQARMLMETKWLGNHKSVQSSVTNAKLQECMQNIIRRDTVNAEALDAVHSSMERVWKGARQHLLALKPLETITEQV